MNLPEGEKTLAEIVTWLAVGGWVVTEELDHFPVASLTAPGVLRRFIAAVEQLLAENPSDLGEVIWVCHGRIPQMGIALVAVVHQHSCRSGQYSVGLVVRCRAGQQGYSNTCWG